MREQGHVTTARPSLMTRQPTRIRYTRESGSSVVTAAFDGDAAVRVVCKRGDLGPIRMVPGRIRTCAPASGR